MSAPAITNLNGAIFSLLRLLFFGGPDQAEWSNSFVERAAKRGDTSAGETANSPRLFEYFARGENGRPERSGWIWIDHARGKGAFFRDEVPAGTPGVVSESLIEASRPPRHLRRRLARLLKLSLATDPQNVDVMAWNIHALNAVRNYDEKDRSRRYAEDLIGLFMNIQEGANGLEQCEMLYRRVLLNTRRYTVPQYQTGWIILALSLLIRTPAEIMRYALATAIVRSYKIETIPAVTLESMVDSILRSVLAQDGGLNLLVDVCADLQAEADSLSKNSLHRGTFSLFASDLYMAGAPYAAALLGWRYLTGDARTAGQREEMRARENYCDERLAKIGASLGVGHELLYRRRALSSFKGQIVKSFHEGGMKGEIAISNVTARDMLVPLYWLPFLKGETDLLTGI